MGLRLFDVHAHYQDARFDEDRDELFEKMKADGVVGIIDSGDSYESSVQCIATAEKYDYVYAAVGIHPLNVSQNTSQEEVGNLRKLLRHPKAVAVGEIGLDYYWEDAAPKELQQHWVMRQIDLAAEFKKPIVFHDREAHRDSVDMLKYAANQGVAGIMHCFSGSVEMMREIIQLGFSISLGGVVTFQNARKAVEVAREVPLDNLLLETDCPYLAPVPLRGKRNYSSLIAYTAKRIAEIRGMTAEEICNITCNNSIRMFQV